MLGGLAMGVGLLRRDDCEGRFDRDFVTGGFKPDDRM